jgi:hypothetical protein
MVAQKEIRTAAAANQFALRHTPWKTDRKAEEEQPDIGAPASEALPTQRSVNPLRSDPWVIKTVNIGGYRIRLQERRRSNQMQIKFGEGRPEDEPSASVLNLVTSPKGSASAKLFNWNSKDQAWAMRIARRDHATSRRLAEQIFTEVVKLVTSEKGTEVGQVR